MIRWLKKGRAGIRRGPFSVCYRPSPGAQQVPFAFLLPNETTPVAQPYLSQPGIYHLAGKQGALAYQSLRGDSGMPAAQIARETTQQRLSLLMFIVLLLLGALVVGVGAAMARRRSAP